MLLKCTYRYLLQKIIVPYNKLEFVVMTFVCRWLRVDRTFYSVTIIIPIRNLLVFLKKKREHIPQMSCDHIRDVRRIRRHLPLSIAKSIASALVSSILNNGNSFFFKGLLLRLSSNYNVFKTVSKCCDSMVYSV